MMTCFPAVQVVNLTHRFPNRTAPVLRDVTFTLYPGEWLAVVGPNEAGKSTLVRILATLIKPTQGHITICRYDVIRQPRQVRRCVGVLLDSERSFYYRLTAYQNLAFFAALYGLRGKTLAFRVERSLDMVGLTHARDVLFMQLSTGMRKRLALARALLRDNPVYLLDEPTAHLDPEHEHAVLDLIAQLREQRRAVLTTAPSIGQVGNLADQIVRLERGSME